MRYLLDTHAWLWAVLEPERLSAEAKGVIMNSHAYEELLISAVSVRELGLLVAKGRIVAPSPDLGRWIAESAASLGARILPLTGKVAYDSTVLPGEFHADPADQMIVALARDQGATLITADRFIRQYPHVTSVW